MKDIKDILAISCFLFIDKDDFLMHLLHGILVEYDSIIALINSTPKPMEVEDVLSLLPSQELQIQIINMESLPVAHMTTPSAHSIDTYNKKEPNKFNENRPDFVRNNIDGVT